jgi:hypothetical protein
MALIIRDTQTKQLAEELAFLLGETETGAVQLALARAFESAAGEPASRRRPGTGLRELLESEVWPLLEGCEACR